MNKAMMLVVSVVAVALVACGGEEPCPESTCTQEELGAVHQVQETALCCWCDVPPPGCTEDPEPLPPVEVALTMTNQTGTASAWVYYSIVVTDVQGTVRSDASRWGMMEMDGATTSTLSSPATPFPGDHVKVTISKDSATTTQTFTAWNNVTCSGTLVLYDGTAFPSVSCLYYSDTLTPSKWMVTVPLVGAVPT